MSDNARPPFDSAIVEIDTLTRSLKKRHHRQVRSGDERSTIKATSFAWFNSHRGPALGLVSESALTEIDGTYRRLLSACERNSTRSKYISELKSLKSALVEIRSEALVSQTSLQIASSDQAPDFRPLISDLKMQRVLARRWSECIACVQANAPLAATVMMGGLLEALLLARVNSESNATRIFRAASAPKDRNGKTLQLQGWTLKHYIDVAHELNWISQSAKDVGEVLRDYRNYIHPYKELAHGVSLTDQDARLFWEIGKSISRQIIQSSA